jgi:hypothetical protein
LRVSFHARAFAEVREAFLRYEGIRQNLGSRFLRNLGLAIRDVIEAPEAWSPAIGKRRKRNLSRFPYAVVYRVEGDLIAITAVAHHKRRKGYWRGRD